MIPLYAFLEGDSVGILLFSSKNDSMVELVHKLLAAAAVRVAANPAAEYQVYAKDELVSAQATVGQLKLKPLDKIEVRRMPHEL